MMGHTHRFCIAPMMEWTDRHCRYLHRLLTRHALLYTEMVTAEAVIRGHRMRLLDFDPLEHPVAVQLGGAEPARLALAARIAEDFGYDEVNLNVGCPSDRVQSGRFGACLMREPMLVAECVAAMRQAVHVPVTVKCRLGVDEQDPEKSLRTLICACGDAGITTFLVHARKAWLSGLSPKENRDVPPLDYELVYRIKRENPELAIILNGGIETLNDAARHLHHVDGVMMGRAAYRSPAVLADVDARFFGGIRRDPDDAAEDYLVYVERRLREGVPLHAMTRHMLGLFNGRPGARGFRRYLGEQSTRPAAGGDTLRAALAHLAPLQTQAAA
ncbi:MAG TPA: tRNA dihydrouridine(20/20a) synthase DusA [Rhizomicrobium sp.]|jgi:tRNA-dihydrouridine synthase A